MWEGYQWIDLNEYIKGLVLTHEGLVDETCKIGVKTKMGCEDPSSSEILPPGSYVLIFGKLIGFERQYFATPRAKVAVCRLTGCR